MPKRHKLRRRDQSRSPQALLGKIEAGQPWDRPQSDLEIDLALYQMLTGHDHFGRGFTDRKEMAAVWAEIGDDFTAGHVARKPGSRPWAWWEFEATEPRHFEGEVSPASRSWFGAPSAHAGQVEPESDYLSRLQLLKKGEIPVRREETDPVTAYARQITEMFGGAQERAAVACVETRWACERHLRDLKEGWRRGLWLDRRRIDYRLTFSRYIHHYQGPKAKQVHCQEPWQEFRNGSIEGWRLEDGSRRFTSCWLEVGRGNGKTFMSAEDAIYAAAFDGESGAEVLAAATKRDQAAKCLTDAINIVRQSPLLNDIFSTTDPRTRAPRTIYHRKSLSIVKTITSAANTEDSHNCSKALLDEVHAYKDSTVWDILRGAIGKRCDAGISGITTAGFDADGFGGQQHDFYRNILDPDQEYDSDSVFALIYTLDSEDEWKNPDAWVKANPNLDVSVSHRDLGEHVSEAKLDPSKVNDLLVKRFCVWTTSSETWLPWTRQLDDGRLTGWKHCTTANPQGGGPVAWRAEQLEKRIGERCYVGIDRGEKLDPAAMVAYFPDALPIPVVIPWFWVPDDGLRQRADRDRAPYDVWAARGLLETSPGVEIDDVLIERQIRWFEENFDLWAAPDGSKPPRLRVGYDPWQMKDLVKRLDSEGYPMQPARQGVASMSEPSKELEAMVSAGRFDHGSHPMLAWNAKNATVRRDANGNIMPDKKRAVRKRIDGIVALVIALRVFLDDQEMDSAYDEEGVSFI